MAINYLKLLDGTLRSGAQRLSERFLHPQLEYVLSQIQPDGGFAGRRGGSDIYYTDFALRTISLISPDLPDPRIADYVEAYTPMSLVDLFNYLNGVRILSGFGMVVEPKRELAADIIASYAIPSGGYSRKPAAPFSAYGTFLASLCIEILDEGNNEVDCDLFSSLTAADGGYRDSGANGCGETNATAAVIACFVKSNTLSETNAALAFLSKMQAQDGGFKSAMQAPESDLLSTFTALASLITLDSANEINLTSAARFIASLADPLSGFKSSSSDPETDIEYTYYGLASLAILRSHADSRM